MEFRDWYSEENWLWFAHETFAHAEKVTYLEYSRYLETVIYNGSQSYASAIVPNQEALIGFSFKKYYDNICEARESAIESYCKNQNMPVPWCDISELEKIEIQEDELVFHIGNPWLKDNSVMTARDVLLNFIRANASFYDQGLCERQGEYLEVWVNIGRHHDRHPGYVKFYKTYTRFTLKDLKEIALWVHGKFPTLPE